jgi:hypothetical protein
MLGQFDYMADSGRGDGGLFSEYNVNPTYYTYQLYQHFGSQVIQTESSVEYLGVYGALRDDGALTLIAVNQGDETTNTPLNISGFEGTVSEVRLLTEETLAEVIENAILVDGMLTMPARSAVLIVLE